MPSTAYRDDGKVWIPFFNSSITPSMYPRPSDGAIIIHCRHSATPDPRGPGYPPLDNCIVLNKLGNLIMTASTATSVTSPRQHPKIDNSTCTYRGRSYGKGSSTDLFPVFDTTEKSADQGFSYLESGYNTNVSCRKQAHVVFPFKEYNDDGVGQLSLWTSQVVMLDSGNVSIPPFDVASLVFNGVNSHPFGYFVWTAFSDKGVYYIATSSQPKSWSHSPNNILCTIEFAPMTFRTNISTVDQFITVTPLERIDDFNQTGNITDAINLELDLLSRASSSSLTFASLYYAIKNNWQAAKVVYSASNDTAWELSLQDTIIEVVDDLLTWRGILAVSRGGGQSVPQSVQRHFAAIKIGQTEYHTAQLVINIVLCMIYLYEANRTRYWKHLPDFDFLDTKALTLAALGPEKSNERDKNNPTKLVAFYHEKSRPRLRYLSAPGERQQTTFADEQSLDPLRDLGSSRNSDIAMQDRDGIDLSDADLKPLLVNS